MTTPSYGTGYSAGYAPPRRWLAAMAWGRQALALTFARLKYPGDGNFPSTIKYPEA